MPPSFDLKLLTRRDALKRIAFITVLAALLGVLYAWLAPQWYRSVLTVVPTRAQKSGLSGLLGGAELGGLATGLADSMGASADGARIAAVLQSIAVSDAVIDRFELRTRYRERYQESAREALWTHCGVKVLPKPNLVQLSCEDKDPRFVQQMLAFFAEYGNAVFRRVSVSSASEEVRFLEKRASELRQQADDAAACMREFQEKHQIVDLDTQSKAVVSALAALQSQRITKQMELDYARSFASADESTMQQLRSQLSVMDEQQHALEQSPSSAPSPTKRGKDGTMFPPALAVPKLRQEFESLYRDRKVAETTLVFALERLEGARANEARDVSTFQVLDPPTLPTHRSRPKRLLVLVMSSLSGLLCAVALEWMRNGGGLALLSSHSGAESPQRSRVA